LCPLNRSVPWTEVSQRRGSTVLSVQLRTNTYKTEMLFIYLVHSRAGLQSKLCTEDNLEILNVEDLIQSVCGICI